MRARTGGKQTANSGLAGGWSFGSHVADDGLGARADVHLFEDVFEVVADGVHADFQIVGNHLVGMTLGQQQQNLLLAGGQAQRFVAGLGLEPEGDWDPLN